MRLRWKFFLVLLGFALVPMLVLTHVNRRQVERLGRSIAAEGNAVISEVVKNELRQTAEDFALVIRRSKSALDFSLAMAAAEAERLLFAPPLPRQDHDGHEATSVGVHVPEGVRPDTAALRRLAGLAPTAGLLRS